MIPKVKDHEGTSARMQFNYVEIRDMRRGLRGRNAEERENIVEPGVWRIPLSAQVKWKK